MIGQKFNRLTVIKDSGIRKHEKKWWLCLCDCGKEAIVATSYLKNGHIKSCGCLAKEVASSRAFARNYIDGYTKEPLYNVWRNMIKRCTDTTDEQYYSYGGRGITVCDRWLSYWNFAADMGERPSEDSVIDRINNNKGYSKENCRWTTHHINNRNKRNNVWITYDGETFCLTDWANILGVSVPSICNYAKRNYCSSSERVLSLLEARIPIW